MRKLIYNQSRMSERRYTALFEPAEEGGYIVTCPALPCLVTEGDTLDEARAMARGAIRGYLESLRTDSLPIPEDTSSAQIRTKFSRYHATGLGVSAGRCHDAGQDDQGTSRIVRVSRW